LHFSDTTRKPRPGEEDGKHYFFVTKEEFLKLKQENGFIETAEYAGNYYGTSKMAVRTMASQGKICVLDIELQGVKAIKETDLGAHFLFIMPPSVEILEARLRGRKTDTEEAIQKRLAAAKVEIEFAKSAEAPYESIFINDDLDKTTAVLIDWVDENYFQ
jgi:guanylate kinase